MYKVERKGESERNRARQNKRFEREKVIDEGRDRQLSRDISIFI